ncbi:MAG: outer membrane protein assembly factor BamA [Candidatus Poribacteria bacterium]|nr:outer membrane protein assembly factor BamA [Candidatus Poribacteria bacterium]
MKVRDWQLGLLAVILGIILSVVPAAAEEPKSTSSDNALIVKKISFQGSENLAEDNMLSDIIQTQIGKEISPDQLSKDIRNLYKDTGFFADIAVDVGPADEGGLAVIYRLTENPKIDGSINIIGNEKLKYKKIKKAITLKSGEILSDRRLWQSERNVLKTYKKSGYYLAEVQTHADVNPADNTVSVTFEITEGQRIQVEEISFTGNHTIPSKTLSKKMKTRVGKHFDEGFLEEDLTALVTYYQDQGYAQARIVEHQKGFSDDKTGLMLDITVDEGPQFIIDSYTVEIEQSEKPAFSEKKIRDMLKPAEGELFNQGEFEESLVEIQQAYHDKGYILAEVNRPIPHYDETNGLVKLSLSVNEGDVIVIDQVRINGLEKTKDNVIRRELNRLDIKSGEFFDIQAIRKARQKIFQMGPFIQHVDIVPSDSEGNRRDLMVSVTETSRTGLFSLGGGYGTEGGIFGVAEVGENNLFGRAYRLHLKGELGARDRHTGEIKFSTPWILGTPTRLNVSLYNIQRVRRYYGEFYRNLGYDRYVYKRKGASLTVGRPISKNTDLSIGLKNEDIDARRDDVEEITDRTTRSITFRLSRDTRDYLWSIYEPVAGALNTLSYEFSGGFLGADNEFQKYTADSSWFFNTWHNMVFATHVRGAYLNSKTVDSRFLFFERYLLGGIDTVRGYEDYAIFPSNNNPNGGNKVFYANFEYRIPLANRLTGVLFFDIGQVWDESRDNILKDINLKKGAGVGIRFDLMGMLARLEWGYGFDREINGRTVPKGKFHFTIGPGF